MKKDKYDCKECGQTVRRGYASWHPVLGLCGKCYHEGKSPNELSAVKDFLQKELTPEVIAEFWSKAFADTTESKTALTQAVITDLIVKYREKMVEHPTMSIKEILDQLREWIKVYIVLKGEVPLPSPITIYGSAEFIDLGKRIKGRYEKKRLLEGSGDSGTPKVGRSLPGVGKPSKGRS